MLILAIVQLSAWQYLGFTAVHAAAERGQAHTLERLADLGANLYSTTGAGDYALQLAAKWGHLATTKYLVGVGSPPVLFNAVRRHGLSAPIMADPCTAEQ